MHFYLFRYIAFLKSLVYFLSLTNVLDCETICIRGTVCFSLLKMSDLETRKNLKSLAGRELKLKDMSYFRQLLRNFGITRKVNGFLE